MNPESSSGEGNYQTTEMDPASKNRCIWLPIESDPIAWLDWSSSDKSLEVEEVPEFKEPKVETNIHPDVTLFIASNKDALYVDGEFQYGCPTPRSWAFVSKMYSMYEVNKNYFSDNDLYAVVKGAVGDKAAIAFTTFLLNKTPLVDLTELVSKPEESLDKIEGESMPRQLLTMKNIARELAAVKKMTPKQKDIFIKAMGVVRKDLMTNIMRFIKFDLVNLNKKLMDSEEYLDQFASVYQLIN